MNDRTSTLTIFAIFTLVGLLLFSYLLFGVASEQLDGCVEVTGDQEWCERQAHAASYNR